MLALIIILGAGLLLVAIIQRAPVRTRSGGQRTSVAPLDREQVASRWEQITVMAGGEGMGLRHAVSEADKLFDHVLRAKGFAGDTMAERLKRSEHRLSDHNAVWRAHKLRNSLAHEVQFDLVASQAQAALRDFERGLKDLEAL